ncbi:hypothetical protein QBC33DRAFT_65891 [Phialemonium atrogriseum]|uniref:Uncharacterized protein n=1 Tax=Phialemonium atrogriseum TaxID=1093897 RepID=A0AAJ0BZE6_9PEZI|nr:uncharacterized protein QBC33DRAFT_65891 [Phialemonium atrogriseum]KAK1767333.1 hypothetical protein QBC33DRAFT_65891 [Phialemonium atrogriseum]
MQLPRGSRCWSLWKRGQFKSALPAVKGRIPITATSRQPVHWLLATAPTGLTASAFNGNKIWLQVGDTLDRRDIQPQDEVVWNRPQNRARRRANRQPPPSRGNMAPFDVLQPLECPWMACLHSRSSPAAPYISTYIHQHAGSLAPIPPCLMYRSFPLHTDNSLPRPVLVSLLLLQEQRTSLIVGAESAECGHLSLFMTWMEVTLRACLGPTTSILLIPCSPTFFPTLRCPIFYLYKVI